jgi:hypothetical protein
MSGLVRWLVGETAPHDPAGLMPSPAPADAARRAPRDAAHGSARPRR